MPTVVVSHGTGGSGGEMEWLVRPLAEAGFRTVAVDHHGNNCVDGYEPEGFLFVWERPRDVTFVLDALAREAPLGPVGVAGFSLGGYTAAALAGARVDTGVGQALLRGDVPLPDIPEFPDVLDALRRKLPGDRLRAALADAGSDVSDRRVRAVFQVAPSDGGRVTRESLAAVDVPFGIRWGGADTIAPFETDTRPYLEDVPGAAARSAGADVRHEDFFQHEPAGAAVRARVAADAVRFFRRHLGSGRAVSRQSDD
ncbi:MAG TPA: alpha/beta fold hydrolase [Streptomyces sp.]|nr:alpha/beta fold hydrolase [Streptomyces sp.]